MNIGTNSLFKLLTSKLDSVLGDKVEESKNTNIKLADNKNISTMIKDKTIQVVLSSFFKELSNDKKISNSIKEILENNKKNFDIKNMKNEIKDIIKFLESEPKLSKQLDVLKELLIDIDTIDEKKLKNMIKNSGVFLESKLLKSDTPLSSNIKILLSQINIVLDDKIEQDKLPNLKEEIKNSLSSIIEKIINIQDEELPSNVKNDIKAKLTEYKKELSQTVDFKDNKKVLPLLKNIENYITTIKDEFSKIEVSTKTFFVNNTLLDSKSIVSTDLKTIILQIDEFIQNNDVGDLPKELKSQIEKIQTQIEYFQLLSIVSNANYSALPFDWDNIENADIKFDRVKDNFSCQINLELKKQGELRVLLQLDNKKNLEITIGVESNEFKKSIQSNLQKLRIGINNIGLIVQSINVFDISDKTKSYEQNIYENQSNTKIDFGYDIKV